MDAAADIPDIPVFCAAPCPVPIRRSGSRWLTLRPRYVRFAVFGANDSLTSPLSLSGLLGLSPYSAAEDTFGERRAEMNSSTIAERIVPFQW